MLQFLLFKINKAFGIQLNLDYEAGREKSECIIESLRDKPWHQGFKKYLAQVRLFESTGIYAKNILALIMIAIALPFLFCLSLIFPSQKNRSVESLYIVAGDSLGKKLTNWHANLFNLTSFAYSNQYRINLVADRDILRYMLTLFRHHRYMLFHPYLVLVLFLKLCRYNAMVKVYQPRRVFSFNERSFVGPFETEFLNQLGIEHNLIMHGYRLFNVKDAFCAYDKIYVFGEHFAKLFCSMGAMVCKYIVMGHPSLTESFAEYHLETPLNFEVLLVLQPPEVISLKEIKNFFDLLTEGKNEYSVVIKPRKDGDNWLERELPKLRIESGRTNHVVLSHYSTFCGKHSTFLIEAWALGKKVVLLGSNAFPPEIVSGPNVLRLKLKEKDKDYERKLLHSFLNSPTRADWAAIQYVFSRFVYTLDEMPEKNHCTRTKIR